MRGTGFLRCRWRGTLLWGWSLFLHWATVGLIEAAATEMDTHWWRDYFFRDLLPALRAGRKLA